MRKTKVGDDFDVGYDLGYDDGYAQALDDLGEVGDAIILDMLKKKIEERLE